MARQQPIVSWDRVPVIFDIPLAAEILGFNQEYTRQLLASGEIPAFKVGNSWRINKSEFLEWIEKRVSSRNKKEECRR